MFLAVSLKNGLIFIASSNNFAASSGKFNFFKVNAALNKAVACKGFAIFAALKLSSASSYLSKLKYIFPNSKYKSSILGSRNVTVLFSFSFLF